jgi:DNA-directed RNA polymerase specialized sigma24 family protein
MAEYRFLDNAFWEEEDHSKLKCIRMTKLGPGKEKKDELTVHKFQLDGSENPLYNEVIDALTIEGINASTAKRIAEKAKRKIDDSVKRDQDKQAKELEKLYTLKLQAFEIEDIKNCKEKTLRSKVRRAKNEVELNASVTMVMAYEMGFFK